MVSTAYDEDRLGGRRRVGHGVGGVGCMSRHVTAWCVDNDHHHEILRLTRTTLRHNSAMVHCHRHRLAITLLLENRETYW
jgi:hypothetical protein